MCILKLLATKMERGLTKKPGLIIDDCEVKPMSKKAKTILWSILAVMIVLLAVGIMAYYQTAAA